MTALSRVTLASAGLSCIVVALHCDCHCTVRLWLLLCTVLQCIYLFFMIVKRVRLSRVSLRATGLDWVIWLRVGLTQTAAAAVVYHVTEWCMHIQCESKILPWNFLNFFPKRLGIFSPNFTRLLHVSIYAGLQIFIQLLATLTKLCHVKRDHHNVLKMSTIDRNARWVHGRTLYGITSSHCWR